MKAQHASGGGTMELLSLVGSASSTQATLGCCMYYLESWEFLIIARDYLGVWYFCLVSSVCTWCGATALTMCNEMDVILKKALS